MLTINEYKISFNIKTMEFMDGDMPRKQKRLIQAWAELHIEELTADWKLAMNGEFIIRCLVSSINLFICGICDSW